MSKNEENIYSMLHLFRNWNKEWDLMLKKFPSSVDDFVAELSKKYEVHVKSGISKLNDEKFLADLKAAIESGIETSWVFNGEDEVPFDTFDSDEALAAVVKFLEGETTTCESCHKAVPLQWAIVSGDEDACYKCYSEMVSDYIRFWIPIEEAELNDTEPYDLFTTGGERHADFFFINGRFINTQYHDEFNAYEITHIMKRPADPEI